MGFIESYKRLEKLCGDLLGSDRRVTAYIEEMEKLPFAVQSVPCWNGDLAKLKYYRHVRNKISHEPECTEENMCSAEDEKWINEFYMRIVNQNDPLAQYRRAKLQQARKTEAQPKPTVPQKKTNEKIKHYEPVEDFYEPSGRKNKFTGVLIAIALLLFVCGIVIIANSLL